MDPRATLLFLAALAAQLCGEAVNAAYTEASAKTALYLAKASYCETEHITDWSCESCTAVPGMQKMRVFADAKQGTQAFMGVSSSHIVLSFRGSHNIHNWIDNIHSNHMVYPNADCIGCTVHIGFFVSYNSSRNQMWEYLQLLVKAHPTLPVLITGHSLGGAMALLAAVDFASAPYASGKVPRIELYTFGEPRVGNAAFANWAIALFCSGGHESHRVTHKRDVVPHVPPAFMGFEHVPNEVWYSNDSSDMYNNCSDLSGDNCSALSEEEDPTCSNSIYPASIADHLYYLGMCTSCACISQRKENDGDYPISPALLEVLALDYKYQQEKLGKKVPSTEVLLNGMNATANMRCD